MGKALVNYWKHSALRLVFRIDSFPTKKHHKAGDDPNSVDLFLNDPVISGNKVYLNASADIVSVDLTNGR